MFPITARLLMNETGLPIKRCEQIVSQASGGKRIGRNYVATREDIAAVLHLHIHEGETEEGRQDLGGEDLSAREAAKLLRQNSTGGRKQSKGNAKPRLELLTHEPDVPAVRDFDIPTIHPASLQEMERSGGMGA